MQGKGKHMRITVSALVAVAVAVGLAGCGGEGSDSGKGAEISGAPSSKSMDVEDAPNAAQVTGKAAAAEITKVIHKVAICKSFDGPHRDIAGALYVTCSDTDDANAGNKYVDVRTVVPDAATDEYDPDQIVVDGPASAPAPWTMTLSYVTNAEAQQAAKATGGHIVG